MNNLIYAVFFVPGLKEILLTGIIFLILKKIKKNAWPVNLTLATFYTSLFFGMLFLIISLTDHNRYLLLPVIYFAAALAAYLCHKNTTLQKFSLIIAALVFALLDWQFTFVHHITTTKAQWKIGDVTKIENGYDGQIAVELIYGCERTGEVSNELAEYLKTKTTAEVDLVLRPMYHYGKLAGYNIDTIDGRHFSSSNGWSGNSCTSSDPKPYPEYYFGIRGLTFSHMYKGWKP